MKRFLLSLTLLSLAFALSAAMSVTKMEPSFWWVGMKNTELQIMVYGPGICQADVAIASPGVTINKAIKSDSPNYLFIYLDLSKAKPGMVKMIFTLGKDKKTVYYELKSRGVNSDANKGFSTSDVLYLLMPDRFANGNPANDNLVMKNATAQVDRKDPNARHGGDLAGIEKRLDYLTDLGVTALWLNPVLENDMPGGCYHGYATTDYYRIDPRFGTNEDYVNLIKNAHQKGLKVVMDMIFNHCGSEHVWCKDKPFGDWFNFEGHYVQTNHAKYSAFDPYASAYDTKSMDDGWFVESMPDLNQRNPHLARYLIQNSIWWVEFSGIDAIRQDTYPYADAAMMSEWCKAIMNEYPQFNIVGEAWYKDMPAVAYWQADSTLNARFNSHLKTVMDFPLMLASHHAFHSETDWDNGLTTIYELLSLDAFHQDIENLLVFLENHDTDRFLLDTPANLDIFKQANAFLLTSRGIPQLYYGSEILMNGDKKKSDGYVRRDFPGGWSADTLDAFTSKGRTALQNEAHDYISTLLHWRKGNDIIAKGTLKHFAPRNGAYVYVRAYKGQKVLVILNGVGHENTILLDQYAEVLNGISSGKDVLTGKTVLLGKELKLAPRETLILEL